MCEHKFHVLFNAWEASTFNSHQEITHLQDITKLQCSYFLLMFVNFPAIVFELYQLSWMTFLDEYERNVFHRRMTNACVI